MKHSLLKHQFDNNHILYYRFLPHKKAASNTRIQNFAKKMIDFFLLIDEIDVIFVADKQAKN